MVFLFVSLKCAGTTPRMAAVHFSYSENDAYYFKSTPYSYQPRELGKTVIYETQTGKVIDSIDQYMNWQAELSNDGRTLFHVLPYASKDNYNQWPVVEIFRRGKRFSYSISDLISDSTRLNRGWSRTSWLRKAWLHNDTLMILTRERKATLIDTNLEIHIVLANEIERRFQTNVPKDRHVTGHYIKTRDYSRTNSYSAFSNSPILEDGQDFHASLIEVLRMEEVRSWEEADLAITVEILIDKSGRGALYSIRVNDKADDIDTKDLKARLSSWTTLLRFKPDAIPTDVEKWLFDNFAYLTR